MNHLRLALTVFLLLSSTATFAYVVAPVINYNVHVLKNATPAQCTSSMESEIGAEITQVDSAYGNNDELTSPGVQSCTDCAIDSQSKDCVCGTCYQHFNE